MLRYLDFIPVCGSTQALYNGMQDMFANHESPCFKILSKYAVIYNTMWMLDACHPVVTYLHVPDLIAHMLNSC